MKNKNCKVRIVNNQTIEGESDRVEIETQGTFSEINDSICISYKRGNSLSILKICNKDKVVLIKNKPYKCEFIIEKEMVNECLYQTEYGTLNLKVEGEYINYQFNDDDAFVELKYKLYANSKELSSNDMKIYISF